MCKVSVIIPIFNGEEYLRNTFESLQAQTLESFEVLCIDDNSTDNSAEIIQDFSRLDKRFRYIRTPKNLGIVPKVMDFAKDYMKGDYFIYSSQDDFFSLDWLSSLIERALDTDSDATVPILEFYFEDGEHNKRLVGANGDTDIVISGVDAFFLSLDWTIPGNALWKSELIHKYGYFDFGMYADEYTARFYFLSCKKVSFSRGVFYYHQGNPNAITKKVSPCRLDFSFNEYRIYRLIVDRYPSSPWRSKYCERVVYSIYNAAIMHSSHRGLIGHWHRMNEVLREIRTEPFKGDLKRHFLFSRKAKRVFLYFMILNPKMLNVVGKLKSVVGR